MIDRIKSKYIVEYIFSFLSENDKLDLIRYNKILMNKLSININDYKKLSDSIISTDENGISKLHLVKNNLLLFEGKYINGKREGKGKSYQLILSELTIEGKYKIFHKFEGHKEEYNFGNFMFKDEQNEGFIIIKDNKYIYERKLDYIGEYLNGKRHGYGKEYDEDGVLWFEGLYEFNKRKKGKEYYDEGKLLFEGVYSFWKLSKRNVEEYDDKGNYLGKYFIYEINWNGEGKEYDEKGNLIFEGEFRNRKIYNGKRIEYYDNGNKKYEEEFKNGEKNGKGKEYDKNGKNIIENVYLDKKRLNGKIKEYYSFGFCIKKSSDWGKKRQDNKKIVENFNDKCLIGKYTDNNIIQKKNISDDGSLKEKNMEEKNRIYFDKKVNDFNNGKECNNGILIFEDKNIKGIKTSETRSICNFFFEIKGKYLEKIQKEDFFFEIHSKREVNGLTINAGKIYNLQKDFTFEGDFLPEKGEILNGKFRFYNNLIDNNLCIWEFEYKNGEIIKRKNYNEKGNLIYEGPFYLNGFGKEYDDEGKLIFNGEYKNGLRWNGKGIEKIIFSKYPGYAIIHYEYKNGKKFGKGKAINSGELFYEGEFVNDINEGKGIYYINGTKVYEGNFLNAERSGNGKEYYVGTDILAFEGQFLQGKKWKGKNYNSEGKITFEGEYIDDKMWNGIEYIYRNKGNVQIEYKYLNGQKTGKEKMKIFFSKNKLIFEGESLNGKKYGKGIEYDSKGKKIFGGEYLNDKRNGKGKEYNFDGEFEGEFKNDKKWNGTGINKNGEIDYDIIDGCGRIKEYFRGRLIYEGECVNGNRHGKGIEYNFLTGKIQYEGRFAYGKKFE